MKEATKKIRLIGAIFLTLITTIFATQTYSQTLTQSFNYHVDPDSTFWRINGYSFPSIPNFDERFTSGDNNNFHLILTTNSNQSAVVQFSIYGLKNCYTVVPLPLNVTNTAITTPTTTYPLNFTGCDYPPTPMHLVVSGNESVGYDLKVTN